jgi:ABC-type multidrug transport system fused ATPase/permease subunit
VLRDGAVAEQGRYADLIRRDGGIFAELYNAQFSGKEEASIGVP